MKPPTDWIRTSWSAIADLKYGRALRDYRDSGGSVQVFGTNGPVGFTSVRQAAGPGVVIGRKGAYRGVHYSKSDFWVIDTAFYLLPTSEMNMRWAYYALTLADINGLDSGSAIPSTTRESFGSLQVWFPPLREQQAIAEVLGALDDKIAANTRLAAAADELAGVTYDEFVRTWKRSSMSKVLSPVLGGTPSRANEDFWSPASDLWISARDITSAPSRVVLDTVERISPLATASTKSKPLPVGSVILTARGTVGAVARLARPAAFNQSCYGFAPTHVPAGVLFFSVLRAAEHARKIAHGSVFDTITMSTFDHLEMAWDAVAAPELDAQLSPLLRAIDGAIEENRTLAATRDALLPKLMSGKLRVRDAEMIVERAGV